GEELDVEPERPVPEDRLSVPVVREDEARPGAAAIGRDGAVRIEGRAHPVEDLVEIVERGGIAPFDLEVLPVAEDVSDSDLVGVIAVCSPGPTLERERPTVGRAQDPLVEDARLHVELDVDLLLPEVRGAIAAAVARLGRAVVDRGAAVRGGL